MLSFTTDYDMFSLRLQNYKSFWDAEVQLSKINILIGPNNSGKSAFLKFLLMLKQSTVKYTSFNVDYILDGYLVDLGRFEDIVHYGQKDRKLNFTFRWESEKKISMKNSMLNELFDDLFIAAKKGGLSCDIMPNSKSSKYVSENHLGEQHVFNLLNEELRPLENIKKTKIDNKLGFFQNILEEGTSNITLNQFMILFFIDSFKYINPLHSSPKRTYDKTDDKGIQDIKNLNDVIYFLADSSIEKEKKEALVAKLNEMVRFLGIAKELKLMQAENIPAMQLWVKIGENDFWNNIKDVGYGLSMQLPMLLQSLISEVEGGAWLLFEQPEIHIYPRLQAKFIEAITTLGPNNNYIIETHSDIMVKKLQAMVKEGKLKAEDVAIHYFDRKNEQTTVTRHSVLEDGTLDVPLPEDFYDNSTDLILELLK